MELVNGVPKTIKRSEANVGGYIDVPIGRGLLSVTVQDGERRGLGVPVVQGGAALSGARSSTYA